MKTAERQQARSLRRRDGQSIKEIASIVGVAPSTVSLWVRDIELTPEQLERLSERNSRHRGQLIGAQANARKARMRRQAWQDDGRRRAREGDRFYASGCMLYWAEGSKGRHLRLTNSDPELIRFFAHFLRSSFGVQAGDFRVWCNLFADHETRQQEIEEFWLGVVGTTRRCLYRSTVNRYSPYSQKKRRNKLQYGTCRVSVGSRRILQTIFGSIQELAGFDRPEWLR